MPENKTDNRRLIVVHGDAVSGFRFIGPFLDEESAYDFGNYVFGSSFVVTPVERPNAVEVEEVSSYNSHSPRR